MLKRVVQGGLAAAMLLAGAGSALAQKTALTVYTALENDQVAPYKAAFEAENPNIEISWVRDSTGVITARFLAEKDNPKADVIWGLAATSLLLFKKQNLLEPYTPAGFDKLKPAFRDATAPAAWTGMDAWLAVICYNTAEGAKAKAAKPATWMDLTKPEFKGQVVMPHPASTHCAVRWSITMSGPSGASALWPWLNGTFGRSGATRSPTSSTGPPARLIAGVSQLSGSVPMALPCRVRALGRDRAVAQRRLVECFPPRERRPAPPDDDARRSTSRHAGSPPRARARPTAGQPNQSRRFVRQHPVHGRRRR